MIAALSHYSAVVFALAVAGHQFLFGILNHPKNYIRWFFNSVIIMVATLSAIIWYGAAYERSYLRHLGDLSKSRDFLDYISIFRAFTGFPGLILVLILPLVLGSDSIARNARNVWAKLAKEHVFITSLGVGALFYVLICIASFAQPSMLQNKNFLIAFPVVLIAFTRYVFLSADDYRIFRLAIVLMAIGFITYLATGYPHPKPSYFRPWREQVREVAGIIMEKVKPGDIVLFGTVSMNGYLLQPTKTYLTLIEGRPEVLKNVEVISFPPEKTYIDDQIIADIELRRTILVDALDKLRRDPSRRLLIDLPHGQALSPSEAEMVINSGFCVHVTDFIYERMMFIENLVAPARCVTWARVSNYSRVKASMGR